MTGSGGLGLHSPIESSFTRHSPAPPSGGHTPPPVACQQRVHALGASPKPRARACGSVNTFVHAGIALEETGMYVVNSHGLVAMGKLKPAG